MRCPQCIYVRAGVAVFSAGDSGRYSISAFLIKNASPARTKFPYKRFYPECIRPMRFFQRRCADTIRAEQSNKARQRLMQLHRIAQCGFEQSKLLPD